jgi:hypothetical protein
VVGPEEGGEVKRFWIHDTTVCISDEDDKHSRPVFDAAIRLLRRNGFKVGPDPRIKAWKLHSLASTNRVGRCGDLQVAVECSGRIVKLEFFQEVVRENPNGGRYDFSKLQKMPYIVRLRYLWIKEKIWSYLTSAGYGFVPGCPRWIDDPLAAFNHGWDGEYEKRRGEHRFRRGPDGWPDESELKSWSRKDRDGIVVNHGETRYVLINSRAMRCKVYGGINGMWHCLYGKDESCHRQANVGELRSTFPGPGRHFNPDQRDRSIKRDFRNAILSGRFYAADGIKRHCHGLGVDLEIISVSVA